MHKGVVTCCHPLHHIYNLMRACIRQQRFRATLLIPYTHSWWFPPDTSTLSLSLHWPFVVLQFLPHWNISFRRGAISSLSWGKQSTHMKSGTLPDSWRPLPLPRIIEETNNWWGWDGGKLWAAELQGRDFSGLWSCLQVMYTTQGMQLPSMSCFLCLGGVFIDAATTESSLPLSHTLVSNPIKPHWFTKEDFGAAVTWVCCGIQF